MLLVKQSIFSLYPSFHCKAPSTLIPFDSPLKGIILFKVDFLELRSNTFKEKGLEIYRDNIGTDVSGERAENLQDLELNTVLSLIPEGQTFADLPRQMQQVIKETLGANQDKFKIEGNFSKIHLKNFEFRKESKKYVVTPQREILKKQYKITKITK